MNGIAWPALMRAGLRDLGLRPAEFWALTPAELMVMLGRDRDSGPMDRAGFDALRAAFPDERREKRGCDA